MQRPNPLQLVVYRQFLEQFVVFTDPEWEAFSNELYLKKLNKKDFLIEAGQVCNLVAFISTGAIRYYHIKDGAELTNYFSMEHDLVSAYTSFLTQRPSSVYIQAIESTELILFTKKTLEKLLQDKQMSLKMERFGRMVAESLLCCYDERVNSFLTQSPEERYLALLESGSKILSRIPQHYLANYLGITPVSLSRIRNRISKPQQKLKLAAQ